MTEIRQKFIPETTTVAGPGVEIWKRCDDNDAEMLDEQAVRSRRDVRERFLDGQRTSLDVVAPALRSDQTDMSTTE